MITSIMAIPLAFFLMNKDGNNYVAVSMIGFGLKETCKYAIEHKQENMVYGAWMNGPVENVKLKFKKINCKTLEPEENKLPK